MDLCPTVHAQLYVVVHSYKLDLKLNSGLYTAFDLGRIESANGAREENCG